MRVCMVLRNTFVRDARVAREAASLAAAGHQVTVLCLRAPGLARVEEREGFRVLRAVEPGPLPGPTIRSEAGGTGRARFRPPPAVWLRDRLLAGRFARALRATPADVYHAHDLNTLAPAHEAARRAGGRLVYDAHELYPELTGLGGGERERWRRLEERLIREADAVLVPSAARGAHLRERYGIEPVVVMNCPPARPAADPARSPLSALRDERPLLVYAGGFTPNRGLENLVAAMREVPARLAMLGWGPLEEGLRAQADPASVTFVPPVAPEQVVDAVAGADVGVVSYLPVGLNNVLAAPNKLFEYLHAGLAIASSDVPDARAILAEHRVGAVFDPSASSTIAQVLRALVSDPDLTGMRARARAAAGLYTWETQARALLEVYERLSAAPR